MNIFAPWIRVGLFWHPKMRSLTPEILLMGVGVGQKVIPGPTHVFCRWPPQFCHLGTEDVCRLRDEPYILDLPPPILASPHKSLALDFPTMMSLIICYFWPFIWPIDWRFLFLIMNSRFFLCIMMHGFYLVILHTHEVRNIPTL